MSMYILTGGQHNPSPVEVAISCVVERGMHSIAYATPSGDWGLLYGRPESCHVQHGTHKDRIACLASNRIMGVYLALNNLISVTAVHTASYSTVKTLTNNSPLPGWYMRDTTTLYDADAYVVRCRELVSSRAVPIQQISTTSPLFAYADRVAKTGISCQLNNTNPRTLLGE